MDDISINDPVNVAGMSFLINKEDIPKNVDLHELEEQITNIKHVTSNKKIDLAKEFESEISKLTSKEFQFVEPSLTKPFDPIGSDLDNLFKSMETPRPSPRMQQPTPRPTSYNAPQQYQVEDRQLNFMTNEEKRQNIIGEVFNDIKQEQGSTPIISIDKEREEDEKDRIIEQISFLRETLEDEGENLSRIPNVTSNNSYDECKSVLKILLLKNDRKRYCTFAEEFILLGATGVEWLFDGKKSYFGHTPDMTDWHKSVQSKLRRMRHDTSNLVGGIMRKHNLGSATRLALELLPSMFLYSKMRKSQHKDTLVSDSEFNDGISKLRDFDKKNN